MTFAKYRLLCDLDSDGDFLDANEDFSEYLREIEYRWGRDSSSPIVGKASAGTANCVMKNQDGRFSPDLITSPLYPDFTPGKVLRYEAMFPSDKFNRGQDLSSLGVADTLHVWSAVSGVWGIEDFAAECFTTPSVNSFAVLDSMSSDRYHLEVKLKTVGINCGVVFRWVDSSNYMRLRIGASILELQSVVAGVVSTIGSYALAVIAPGDAVTIDIHDTSIKVYEREMLQMSVTSSANLSGTSVGLWDNSNGSTHQEVNEFHVVYPQWEGTIDEPDAEPDVRSGLITARIRALGYIADFVGRKIEGDKTDGDHTGDLIALLLGYAGWPAGKMDIDQGIQLTGKWYHTTDKDLITGIRELEDTEQGFFHEDNHGMVVYESRQHRQLAAHATVSQATWSDDPTSPIKYMEVVPEGRYKNIINKVTVDVQGFTTDEAPTVVWTHPATPIKIYPNQQEVVRGHFPGPGSADGAYVESWEPLTVDNTTGDIRYAGVDVAPTVFLTHTTGNSIEIYIDNNDSNQICTLTLVQARGTVVRLADKAQYVGLDQDSIDAFKERPWPFTGPWLPSMIDAKLHGDYIVNKYKNPRTFPRVKISANRDSTHMLEVLRREPSDRITLVANNSTKVGINDDFFVEAATHKVWEGGQFHEATFELSPAAAEIVWILGTSLLGVDTFLGY